MSFSGADIAARVGCGSVCRWMCHATAEAPTLSAFHGSNILTCVGLPVRGDPILPSFLTPWTSPDRFILTIDRPQPRRLFLQIPPRPIPHTRIVKGRVTSLIMRNSDFRILYFDPWSQIGRRRRVGWETTPNLLRGCDCIIADGAFEKGTLAQSPRESINQVVRFRDWSFLRFGPV